MIKARFYRGPYNGKVLMVKDSEQTITVAEPNSKFWVDMSDSTYPPAIGVTQHLYYRTKHTHPDGSVFYEWYRPKGSRR